MKRIYWFALSAVGAVALVSSACSTSASGATASVRETKSFPVASTTITFTDHSRPTPASNGYPPLSYRTLSTLVVYPSTTKATSSVSAFSTSIMRRTDDGPSSVHRSSTETSPRCYSTRSPTPIR